MSAFLVTNRILTKKSVFTGDVQRPYVEIPYFGNEVDQTGNHLLEILGPNPNSHGNFDRFLWSENHSPSSYLDEFFGEESTNGPVLLVIHGYNNDFPDAAQEHQDFQKRLKQEIAFQGPHLAYTWPSRGGAHLYAVDRQMALGSTAHLSTFLDTLAEHCRALKRPLVGMCHSMGNFLMRETARYARKALQVPPLPWFDGLIMAGADVNYHLFDLDASGNVTDDGGSALCSVAKKIAVLYFKKDSVLALSESIAHPGPQNLRLGRKGPAQLNALPENVKAKDMKGLVTKHGGYFNEPLAVQALAGVFSTTPPLL